MINGLSVHSSIGLLETKNQPMPENKMVFSDDEHLSWSDVEEEFSEKEAEENSSMWITRAKVAQYFGLLRAAMKNWSF